MISDQGGTISGSHLSQAADWSMTGAPSKEDAHGPQLADRDRRPRRGCRDLHYRRSQEVSRARARGLAQR